MNKFQFSRPSAADYESPSVDIVVFSSELGFAASPVYDWNDGTMPDDWNDLGGY